MLDRLRYRRDRGQDLVEYALVLPLLLLLLLGIMEFSIVIWSYNTIANAAREGARYGIIDPDYGAINVVVRERALLLNQAALQVFPIQTGNTIRVEVTYDVNLITGLFPTLHLYTSSTMQIE